MSNPAKIDIDDVIAWKLSSEQIKCAMLISYGKYGKNSDLAKVFNVTNKQIERWKANKYFKIAVIHFKQLFFYHCINELSALKKASISSSLKLQEQVVNDGDLEKLRDLIDNLDDVLRTFLH